MWLFHNKINLIHININRDVLVGEYPIHGKVSEFLDQIEFKRVDWLDEILKILPEHISPEYAVIDHINPNVVDKVISTDYTLGLTVQPQKMDKYEAISILDEYGFDKFLLNSDISNKESDPLSVPKTVRELKRQGFNQKDIDKIAFKNAEKFFNF